MAVAEKELVEALHRIKAIVDSVLATPGSGSKTKSLKATVASARPTTLPGHILALRDEGFFGQPKTPKEVHAGLSPRYACELGRVEVALGRAASRKELRKTSKQVNKRKQLAYVW